MNEQSCKHQLWELVKYSDNFLVASSNKNDLSEVLSILMPFSNVDAPNISFFFMDVGIQPKLSDSLWYNGIVANIRCREKSYFLVANGDVEGYISRSAEDKEIIHFSSRDQKRSIREQLRDYAQDDEDLKKLFDPTYPFHMELNENNWWELIPADPHDIRTWMLDKDNTIAGALAAAAGLLTSGSIF